MEKVDGESMRTSQMQKKMKTQILIRRVGRLRNNLQIALVFEIDLFVKFITEILGYIVSSPSLTANDILNKNARALFASILFQKVYDSLNCVLRIGLYYSLHDCSRNGVRLK